MTHDLKKTNDGLRAAMSIAKDDPGQAVSILDAALRDAKQRQDVVSISKLARHAGAICEHLGQARRAVGYYQLALEGDVENVSLCIALGGVHRQLGEQVDARNAFSRGLELARDQNNEEWARVAADALAELT
jgi:Flp pilus assembly protein TadD